MYFLFQNQAHAVTFFPRATYLTFEPHVHSHIEIVFMKKGGKSEAFADDKAVVIEQGDLFVTFPNQVHYYQDIEKPLEAAILIVSADIFPEFKKYFENCLPASPILKNAAQNPLIKHAMEILLGCDFQKNDEFSEALIRGSLLVILSEFLRRSTLEKISAQHTDTAKDIINFCYENYTGDISLSSIAEALHISRYYVSRLFANRLHTSFNDYINSLRVRKACEFLKTGESSVTEIAHSVGYNSVRTFDRCFTKIKGITPREYRTKALKKEK